MRHLPGSAVFSESAFKYSVHHMLRRVNASYSKRMADEYEWTPEYYYTGNGNASAYHERGLDFDTFVQRTAQQNNEGLPVRLEVEKPNFKKLHSWSLLMINTKPKAGFPHRSNWAKLAKATAEGFRYHISLCFISELPEGGWDAYERIRERYDGKEGVLKVSVWNAEAKLMEGNAFTEAILNDPDIALLHNAGKYSNRPLHVST